MNRFHFAAFDVVDDEFFVGVVGDFFTVRQDEFAGVFLAAKNKDFLNFGRVNETAAEHKGLASFVGCDDEAVDFFVG